MAHPSPDRERLVVETFVELADTLIDEFDVVDLLQHLVDRCGEVLRVDTAGVMLESEDGLLSLTAGMTEEMVEFERAETAAGDGPCVQAYRTGEQVICRDLEEHRERWPEVVPALLAMGMRAGYAFPLRLRGDRIGALNLYRRQTGPFDGDDIMLAQAFADVAAIAILQERAVSDAELRAAQLQRALRSSVVIEQAKGVLAERHGIPPRDAFEAIRHHSRARRVTVRQVAQDLVDGTLADIAPA